MQDQRENEKQSIWYAVRFHEEGRELCDVHNLEDGKKENRSQSEKIWEMGAQCSQDTREKRVRLREVWKGTCRGFASDFANTVTARYRMKTLEKV